MQKEEDLSSETPSPSLVYKTDRVGTPEIESDTYEVYSDCNCKTSDQELNSEQQNPEDLIQIKKEPVGSIQEYATDSSPHVDSSNEAMKRINERGDLNEEESKKQFAFKRFLNEKGKRSTCLVETTTQ